MITLFHSPFTRSVRILWLLEELGVPYELSAVEFRFKVLRGPDYLRVHPLGQLPALRDGETLMFESGAIVEYLVERYGNGKLAPLVGASERPQYLQWVHYAEASLTRYMSEIMAHKLLLPEAKRIAPMVDFARVELGRRLDVLEAALGERDYILPSGFSAADIMLAYPLMLAERIGEVPSNIPKVSAYHARLKTRAGYQKALAT
jgi:glutathione S-transferase